MAQVWRMTPGHLCKYRYGVLFFTSCYRGWGHCLQGVGYLKVCDNGTAKKSVYDFNVIFPLMSSNKVKSKTHPKPSQSHTHTHTYTHNLLSQAELPRWLIRGHGPACSWPSLFLVNNSFIAYGARPLQRPARPTL